MHELLVALAPDAETTRDLWRGLILLLAAFTALIWVKIRHLKHTNEKSFDEIRRMINGLCPKTDCPFKSAEERPKRRRSDKTALLPEVQGNRSNEVRPSNANTV